MSTLAAACAALAGDVAVPMPWLAPYQPLGRRVALEVMAGGTVAQALNRVSDPAAPAVRFVAQRELPDGEAYETFIARTGCVPTRDNPHDLFNGLVWLRFGSLKRQLNALHVQQIGAQGVGRMGRTGQIRGPLRDALTLFDENAALLQAPEELLDALRRRDWQALFVEHRAAWQGATLTVFGHALLEKLLQPRKAITAHVRPLPALLADAPEPDLVCRLIGQPHLPLPVLGVPGWWAANEDGNFYRDEAVFRPPKKPAARGLESAPAPLTFSPRDLPAAGLPRGKT